MKAKKKPKKVKYYREKADKLFQQVGRQENSECLICGGEYCCLHHFFTKGSSSSLRYDFDNAIPICVSCHFKIHKTQDPEMVATILEKKGKGWYKKLNMKRRELTKSTIGYYKEVIEILENKLNI